MLIVKIINFNIKLLYEAVILELIINVNCLIYMFFNVILLYSNRDINQGLSAISPINTNKLERIRQYVS